MYNRIFLGVSALALTLAHGTGAAELPKATQKALAELKLNASMLEGLDAELAVPKAWLDGAAKEKEVVILGTWDDKQFPTKTAAFRERYPSVKIRIAGAPLLLYEGKENQVLAILIWNMWDEGNIEAVGAIGTLMIIFLLLVTLSLRMIGFGRGAAIQQSSH